MGDLFSGYLAIFWNKLTVCIHLFTSMYILLRMDSTYISEEEFPADSAFAYRYNGLSAKLTRYLAWEHKIQVMLYLAHKYSQINAMLNVSPCVGFSHGEGA